MTVAKALALPCAFLVASSCAWADGSTGYFSGGCGADAAYLASKALGRPVDLEETAWLAGADGTTRIRDLIAFFRKQGLYASADYADGDVVEVLSRMDLPHGHAVWVLLRNDVPRGHFVVLQRARTRDRVYLLDGRKDAPLLLNKGDLSLARPAPVIFVSLDPTEGALSHGRFLVLYYSIAAFVLAGGCAGWILGACIGRFYKPGR